MIDITREDLMHINYPYRYIGQEYGMSRKSEYNVNLRVALCYPNLYDIGMNNYNFMFLYNAINNLKDVSCERCFLPDKDFEKILKDKNQKLYTLESKSTIDKFDFIIFVVSDVLEYTNILKMFELLKLNIEYSEKLPLLIGVLDENITNSYFMSELFDIVIIKELENVYKDIFFRYKVYTLQNIEKKDILESLSKLDGVVIKGIEKVEETTLKKSPKYNFDFSNIYFPISNIAQIKQKIIIKFIDSNKSLVNVDKYVNRTIEIVNKSGMIDVQILINSLTNCLKLEEYITKLLIKNDKLNISINLKNNVCENIERLSTISKIELKYQFLKEKLNSLNLMYEASYLDNIKQLIINIENEKSIKLIEKAYENGAVLYGYNLKPNFTLWQKTCESLNIDMNKYLMNGSDDIE